MRMSSLVLALVACAGDRRLLQLRGGRQAMSQKLPKAQGDDSIAQTLAESCVTTFRVLAKLLHAFNPVVTYNLPEVVLGAGKSRGMQGSGPGLLSPTAIDQQNRLGGCIPGMQATIDKSLFSPSTRAAWEALTSEVAVPLAELRTVDSWCLTEVQQWDFEQQQKTFVEMSHYLDPSEQAHLLLALEVVYKARTARSQRQELRHALAVARMLVSICAELAVVEAALFVNICEGTGISSDNLKAVFGRTGPLFAWPIAKGVSKIWKLAEILEVLEDDAMLTMDPLNMSSVSSSGQPNYLLDLEVREAVLRKFKDRAEQLERQCEILLAGSESSRSLIVVLASRLVSMRELQGAVSGRILDLDELSTSPSRSVQTSDRMLLQEPNGSKACDAFVMAGGRENVWSTLSARKRVFAYQTIQVFVPLALRLSMWYFKSELERLSFAILKPCTFGVLQMRLAEVQERASAVLAEAKHRLEDAFDKDLALRRDVKSITVKSRIKDLHSLWQKMQRRKFTLVDQVDDILALRLIVVPRATRRTGRDTQAMLCSRVLEVVHSVLPMDLRAGFPVEDYISTPKPNGYQSLHSMVEIGSSFVAEVQVRTMEMHQYAEYGEAAHWLYKYDEVRRSKIEEIWLTDLADPRGRRKKAVKSFDFRKAIKAKTLFDVDEEPMVEDRIKVKQMGEKVRVVSSTLRSRRVFATSSDGFVISLRVGATVEEALRTLRRQQTLRTLRMEQAKVGYSTVKSRLKEDKVLRRAIVNRRSVRADYVICNGDVLGPPSEATWIDKDTLRRSQKQSEEIRNAADPDAGVTDDSRYRASIVPWPWSLLQAGRDEDFLAWNAEAERKHGTVALLASCTWLWMRSSGLIQADSIPFDSFSGGVTLVAWLVQFFAYSSAELVSIALNARRGVGQFNASSPIRLARLKRVRLGPSLGPLEPPLLLGRAAMSFITLLALNADYSSEGGILNSLFDPRSTLTLRYAAEVAFKAASINAGDVVSASPVLADAEIPSLVSDVTMLGEFFLDRLF